MNRLKKKLIDKFGNLGVKYQEKISFTSMTQKSDNIKNQFSRCFQRITIDDTRGTDNEFENNRGGQAKQLKFYIWEYLLGVERSQYQRIRFTKKLSEKNYFKYICLGNYFM